MTRERAKELLKAIEWWSNGGNLWYCNYHGVWEKINNNCNLEFSNDSLWYVIEDKHFEARKAHALGKFIEVLREGKWFRLKGTPSWGEDYEYREAKLNWYELEENVGKVVMARDKVSEEWNVGKFQSYTKGEEYPFMIGCGNWKQARLLTEEDLVKNPK